MNNEGLNISYVGDLQDLGRPYVMLFVDESTSKLFLLVRDNNDITDSKFFTAEITPETAIEYLHEKISLWNIFTHNPTGISTETENGMFLTIKDLKIKKAEFGMLDYFDAELCDDQIWIKTFLNRVQNKQPLQVI